MIQTEQNKMIAEYMGYYEQEIYFDSQPYKVWRLPNSSFDDYVRRFDSEVLYHSSFDWLIPVANKLLEELRLSDQIAVAVYSDMLCLAATTFEITPLYNAVCEGIQFLNQQKK